MTPGELARRAVDLGWPREKLLEVGQFSRNQQLPVTRVEKEQIVLADRWLVYRDQDFRALVFAYTEQNLKPNSVVEVWGDGSGTTGDKPAGIGVVIDLPYERIYENHSTRRIAISENIGPGTNNRAELMAVWRGLKEIPDCKRCIVVRTDSEWAIGALTRAWSIQKNVELVQAIRMDLSLRGPQVTFRHVKGHSGVDQNELCDRLARAGRLGV